MATTSPISSETLRCDLIASAVQENGEVQLRVTGDSMVPTLYPGAVVLIRKAEFQSVTLGALAAFQRGGRLFIHRVVFVGNGRIVTCGDAHINPDPAIRESEFIGLVTTIDSGQGASVKRKVRSVTHRLSSLISAASE